MAFGKRSFEQRERSQLKDDRAVVGCLKRLAGGIEEWSPDVERQREQQLRSLRARLQASNIAEVFEIMALAVRFGGARDENVGFEECCRVCHERPEREVLVFAKDWARDSNPSRRLAAVRILARRLPASAIPNEGAKKALLELLADRDESVAMSALTRMTWLSHPAYEAALRSHASAISNHAASTVRAHYEAVIEGKGASFVSAEALPLSAQLGESTIAEILELAFAGLSTDADLTPFWDECHKRSEAEVLMVAKAWARHPDRLHRVVAACVLGRPSHEDDRALRGSIDTLSALARDDEEIVVIAALNSFAQRELEPFLLADRVGHCAEHDSADIRGVYTELFGQGVAASSAEPMLPV